MPQPADQAKPQPSIPAPSFDAVQASRASAGFGPCRVPLWSALVISAGYVSLATILLSVSKYTVKAPQRRAIDLTAWRRPTGA